MTGSTQVKNECQCYGELIYMAQEQHCLLTRSAFYSVGLFRD